ncbi:MAG TPA: OmpA family protein, partial [Terriglobales bacterium]|nr:OmpA family protein [Terriglobales bacterium]
NAMLLGFAASKRSIDEIILAEAARDLDMSSVLADMYRTEPGFVASHRDGVGNSSKVQPIRDAKSLETEDATLAYLSGAHGSFAQKAESHPAAAHSGPGNSGATGESIPLALVEAIVRISQTLEEQKVLLAAAKSVAPAEALPAPAAASNKIASVAGQNPASSGQGLQPTPFAAGTKTTATIRRDSSARVEKGLPLTAEKGIPTLQKAKGAAPPQPQKIAAASGNRPELKKSSESGGFWAKALVLVAVTGILTFVVFEKSPWQNAAQANAEQSDSASGYAALHGSPASTTEGSSRPSQGTATTSRASREVGSDETNDVTVRQFPVEPVATGGSTGAQGARNIFFDQDSAVIAERYRLALQHIADELAKDPDLSAILEGHTDDSGPEVYNLELSSRRATTVRNALINEFNVPSTRLTAIGSGSAAPVQPNSSAVGRAYNRRVAVRFVKLGE